MTRPRTRLRAERLEDRATPAIWNNPWPESDRISMSFAEDAPFPDGTKSNFTAPMSGLSAAVWQGEFLRAANTWAAVANLSVGFVTDLKTPLNEPGPLQGSPYFGDIRVSARSLPADQLAHATPFDLLDAEAGDIVVNTNKRFSTTGATGTFDVYTVALQEVGHALGLPNSADTNSVMFTQYTGRKTGLAASDVAAIQALYGPRVADKHEGTANNNVVSATRATPLDYVDDADDYKGKDPTLPLAGLPGVAVANLTAGDVDVYQVTVPAGLNDMFVQLRTTGVGAVVTNVTVHTASGALVPGVQVKDAATGPLDADVELFASGLTGGQTYYVRVVATGRAGFSHGGYRLSVGKEPKELAFRDGGFTWHSADLGSNNQQSQGTPLGSLPLAAAGGWEWTHRASIDSATDTDFYRFTTGPANSHGTVTAALVTVWAAESGKFEPLVRVYDRHGVALPVEVLGNDGSGYSVQVRNLTANTDYAVEVRAADPNGSKKDGNYFVGLNLRAKAVDLTAAMAGTLTNTAKQAAGQFTVGTARNYSFNLAVGADTTNAGAAVRLTVYDANNRAVGSVSARAGETVNLDLRLAPGTYTLKVSGGTQSGAALPSLRYTVRMLVRNDPIGPGAEDPTLTPTGTEPSAPPVVAFPTASWAFWVDDFSDPWGAA